MIFYFTGTGNSHWVAEALEKALDDSAVSIAKKLKTGEQEFIYPVRADEKIVFVYPVHSWGPALSVLQFISRLTLTGYEHSSIYSVCTCGDECGYTGTMLQEVLQTKGWSLAGSYSVIMPNNYILLPGFDVDTKELEQQKLHETPARVSAIAEAIQKGQNVNLYHIGTMPWVKSKLIYPLFAKFAGRSNYFRVTDACISCGLCERICPTGTISLTEEGKPQWSDTCVQCVACIHRCPVRAIEYGKGTVKKGRYHHPAVNNK